MDPHFHAGLDQMKRPTAPAQLTLADVLEWIKDQETTAAERQSAKLRAMESLRRLADAVQDFQNDKYGSVGQHIVHGKNCTCETCLRATP